MSEFKAVFLVLLHFVHPPGSPVVAQFEVGCCQRCLLEVSPFPLSNQYSKESLDRNQSTCIPEEDSVKCYEKLFGHKKDINRAFSYLSQDCFLNFIEIDIWKANRLLSTHFFHFRPLEEVIWPPNRPRLWIPILRPFPSICCPYQSRQVRTRLSSFHLTQRLRKHRNSMAL